MYVGGSFGSKHFARQGDRHRGRCWPSVTGRPVKFMEDRADNLLASDDAGPGAGVYDAELAVDADGTFRSLRIKVVDDYGAYFHVRPSRATRNALAQIVGPVPDRQRRVRRQRVLTNKNQQGVLPRRGLGRQQLGAGAAGRRRGPGARRGPRRAPPHATSSRPTRSRTRSPPATSTTPATTRRCSTRALELAELDRWRAEQERARAEGRYIGIGLATRAAAQRLLRHRVLVPRHRRAGAVHDRRRRASDVGSARPAGSPPRCSRRSGATRPETVIAQLVAEELGVDPAEVAIDLRTDACTACPGAGPGGSRMTVMLTGAVAGAVGKLKDKIFEIAAHQLEAVARRPRAARRRGVGARAPTAEHVARRHRDGRLLAEGRACPTGWRAAWRPASPTTARSSRCPTPTAPTSAAFYPIVGHGCHVVVVEVDPETGQVEFLKLRGGARPRHGREPALAGGPDPRRHRAGDRGGALRAGRLRRRGPQPHRRATTSTWCPARPTCRGSRWRSCRRPRRGPRTG